MAGEQEFSDFVSARMPAVRGWAYLLTGDHARADDLVQHAFAATYRHWRRISPDSAEAYVRRAVLNAHLSWWRRGWSRHEQLYGELPDRPGADPAVSLEERDELWAALAELPPGSGRCWCCATTRTCPRRRSPGSWTSARAP